MDIAELCCPDFDTTVCYLTQLHQSALPALVGNNRVYRGWGMLIGYYLPGNRAAPPPSPRAGGIPANEEVEQGQFDPVPPGRWLGGGAAKLGLFEISSLLSGAREVEQPNEGCLRPPHFEHYNSVPPFWFGIVAIFNFSCALLVLLSC